MVDGYFIRSLLMAFFFKLFPEIIEDGRLYIAEPPLYRVDNKKDPFVINKVDYINRYINSILKDYKIGYQNIKDETKVEYLNKDNLYDFLNQSNTYVDDMETIVKHYKVNDRLLEIILEEIVMIGYENIHESINKLNIQHLMNRIGEEFNELYYDDEAKLIKGALNGTHQILEISEALIYKSKPLLKVIKDWKPNENETLLLQNIKTGVRYNLSILGVLKILKKYQPNIVHRYKGLGENDYEDIKTTIMDPNTRTLIKVNIGDIENDMKVFQILRGSSPVDSLNRKQMMREFILDKSEIDT